jgi:DNA-binding XRE family transcriptional regulator
MFRLERKTVGLTQQQMADSVKCKRQTISDLEGGRNVGLLTTFIALSTIGKTLAIQDNTFDLDELRLFLESVAE